MAINYEHEIGNLSQDVLAGNTYLQEQAAQMSKLYLDLFHEGGLLPQHNIKRLGVVLIGPSVMEISGMQMALDILGMEADMVGIEYHADVLAKLASEYGRGMNNSAKADEIKKDMQHRLE